MPPPWARTQQTSTSSTTQQWSSQGNQAQQVPPLINQGDSSGQFNQQFHTVQTIPGQAQAFIVNPGQADPKGFSITNTSTTSKVGPDGSQETQTRKVTSTRKVFKTSTVLTPGENEELNQAINQPPQTFQVVPQSAQQNKSVTFQVQQPSTAQQFIINSDGQAVPSMTPGSPGVQSVTTTTTQKWSSQGANQNVPPPVSQRPSVLGGGNKQQTTQSTQQQTFNVSQPQQIKTTFSGPQPYQANQNSTINKQTSIVSQNSVTGSSGFPTPPNPSQFTQQSPFSQQQPAVQYVDTNTQAQTVTWPPKPATPANKSQPNQWTSQQTVQQQSNNQQWQANSQQPTVQPQPSQQWTSQQTVQQQSNNQQWQAKNQQPPAQAQPGQQLNSQTQQTNQWQNQQQNLQQQQNIQQQQNSQLNQQTSTNQLNSQQWQAQKPAPAPASNNTNQWQSQQNQNAQQFQVQQQNYQQMQAPPPNVPPTYQQQFSQSTPQWQAKTEINVAQQNFIDANATVKVPKPVPSQPITPQLAQPQIVTGAQRAQTFNTQFSQQNQQINNQNSNQTTISMKPQMPAQNNFSQQNQQNINQANQSFTMSQQTPASVNAPVGSQPSGPAPPGWMEKNRHYGVNKADRFAWSSPQLQKVERAHVTNQTNQQMSISQQNNLIDEAPVPNIAQELIPQMTHRQGERVHFEVTLESEIIGEATLNVIWKLNGQPIKPSARYIIQEVFGKCSLDILAAMPEDSGLYECQISTASGEVLSQSTLTIEASSASMREGMSTAEWLEHQQQSGTGRYIKEDIKPDESIAAPEFSEKLPPTLHIEEGEPLRLQVAIMPQNDPTNNIEWSRNGQALSFGSRITTFYDFGLITLSILDTREDDSGEYVCTASNQLGVVETRCLVNCSPRGKSTTQPMLQEPLSVTPTTEVNEGELIHIETRTEPRADPFLTVEWLHNGKPIEQGSRFRPAYEFGFATLDIVGVIPELAGTLTIVVRNTLGEIQDSIDLPKINPRCGIITDTQHPEAHAKIAELEYKDFSRTYEYNDISEHEPRITPEFQQELKVQDGEPLRLSLQVEPKNDPNMKIEWFFNGQQITMSNRITNTSDFGFACLDIHDVRAHDAGVYTVRCTNTIGVQEVSCKIDVSSRSGVDSDTLNQASMDKIREMEAYLDESNVVEGNYINENLTAPVFVEELTQLTEPLREGQTIHLEARITPVDDPMAKAEWYFEGVVLRASNRFRVGYDFGYATLDITNLIPEDSGVYELRISNSVGIVTSSTTMVVKSRAAIITDVQMPQGIDKIHELEDMLNWRPPDAADDGPAPPPTFVKQLSGPEGKIKEGQTAHLECRVQPVGDPTLKIDWFHEKKPILTGTRIRATHEADYVALDFDTIYPRDAGEYVCRAKNASGEAFTSFSIYCFARRNVMTESLNPSSLQQIQKLESFM